MRGDAFQIEIRVSDLAAAVRFYRSTFDWAVFPLSDEYALVDTGRMPLVGILQDPRIDNGVAPLYLVNDCEGAAAKAKSLGGRPTFARSEVPGAGAFTMALDPWGNEIYFWQPFSERMPELRHPPVNPFVFVEIAVPSRVKAVRFYSGLMWWAFQTVPSAPEYAIAEGCGLARGVGLYGGSATSGVVSYIEVASLEETAAKIAGNGGEVLVPPEPFVGGGRYLIFADPSRNRVGALER